MIKKIIKNFVNRCMLRRIKKTNCPTIVFESDDWGSIRNSSKNDIQKIKNQFDYVFDNYQLLDCLESDDDLQNLINVLKRHKNNEGIHPKFTLNYVLNNPNFAKCIECGFSEIPLISLEDTYKKSKLSKTVLDKVVENTEILKPQFHANIHFNYDKMLTSFSKESIDRFAIENGCIGMNPCLYSNLDTYNHIGKYFDVYDDLKTGLMNFEKLFGFKSKSMIFPCYVWDKKLEVVCKENNIEFLQGKIFQNYPSNNGGYKRKLHTMGRKTKYGLLALTRNVDFETSKFYLEQIPHEECVNGTFEKIRNILNKNIPAVVCTHRVNYVSGVDVGNRDYSLQCLDKLLFKIVEKYPNVKFMFSDELGDYYLNDN